MGGISAFLTNLPHFTNMFMSFFEKFPIKLTFPVENMVSLVAYRPPRTGRHLQRYDQRGFRLVVGCIPYRYKKTNNTNLNEETIEVLVISAQNGKGMLFPKGGWEYNESMEDAAIRETLEEAGVIGNIELKLGKWSYESKRRSILHEGHMFPMLVKQELNFWPEKSIRTRKWVTISKAKEECPHLWMREALEELVSRQQPRAKEEEVHRTTSK
ncbi:nudix hydrolase homolog 4 [Hibiscus trionum]|uniref:Nudix hydrolase homolog 4 n=1 Tax=Hibiscus trionum TaxID=183268 RepID=A0A9W7IP97_HIBTR|nr:nudix hydrolase homolog 4 [Hibiscus trionum]